MTNKDLWISILKRIQPTIKKAYFLTWFQGTFIIEKKDDSIVIGFPNAFALDWIKSKYQIKIEQAIQEVDENIKKFDFQIDGSTEGVDVKSIFVDEEKKNVRKVRNQNEVKVQIGPNNGNPIMSQMLNNRYSLNNFIVGQDNRLPHAAALAVSNSPGGIYNPLYIYGAVGIGKTHLLQAIGNETLKYNPHMVIKYLTAEKFVSEVVEAIGQRRMPKFKDQYRNVDCFLVDDIQFFQRKDSSQQEFFHTFNALYDNNKQIVLTSDRAPSELDDLDERLKSRFGMGMVVELLFPDFETRLAILNQKCQEFEVMIAPEVLHFIASNVHNNVRELEGVLRQAVAASQLENQVPTIRSVANIIRRLNKAQKIIGFDIESKRTRNFVQSSIDVKAIVGNYFNVTSDQLEGKDRSKDINVPRQICMYIIKNELGHSYEKIGLDFGGRNHTTIMHACNKTAEKLKKDIKLVKDMNAIKQEMGL